MLHHTNIIDKLIKHKAFEHLKQENLHPKINVPNLLKWIDELIFLFTGHVPQDSPEITVIPPEGIIITKPDTYTFSNSIVWKPKNEASVAITIDAKNVTLDMNGHTLLALVQECDKKMAGISVKKKSSVTIKNGTLKNMCYYGIHAEAAENLRVENMTVEGLKFNNLGIRNLSPTAFIFSKCKNPQVKGCTVQNMNVTTDASSAFQFAACSGGIITNCNAKNMVNHDGSVIGISQIACAGMHISGCSVHYLQSHFNGNIKAVGHTVLGFSPMFCLDMHFTDCTASYLTGCCDDCHGLAAFFVADVHIKNYNGSMITDGVSPTNSGAKATGLEIYGVGVTVKNCSVNNIKAIRPQDLQCAGFSSAGDGIIYKQCTASNIEVIDQFGKTNADLGYGIGFGWAPDPRKGLRTMTADNITFTDCTVENCQVGFDTWNHIDSKGTKLTSHNCDIPLRIDATETRIISGDPGSECNPPIVVKLTNKEKNNNFPNLKNT